MTDILKERDERGGYIVPILRPTWWKFTYETKTPTFQAFGRVAFVQATTEAKATAAAFGAANNEYPGAEIIPHALTPSTLEAAQAFAEKRQRLADWLERTRTGEPNDRSSL